MTWTLLTNDDGVDSPALVPFAQALARSFDVRVVVPDRERSWVGKALTRHETLHTDQVERHGIPIWTCSGYPADTVQIGIHGLFPEPPSLVISGINLGYNHGAGFLMSSGTVGAAIEGWIAGIPAVAVSTGTLENWDAWRQMVHDPGTLPRWQRTAQFVAGLLEDLGSLELFSLADVVSINLPFDPPPDTPRLVTTVARVGYNRLFQADGDNSFIHDFGGGFQTFDSLDHTDIAAAQANAISITPLRMPEAMKLTPELRARIEDPHGQ